MTAKTLSKRKSCSECVKAKRKCGMELPKCGRCAKKDDTCVYPSRTTGSEPQIPELEFPWLDDLFRDPGTLPWEGALQPQLDLVSASSAHWSGSYTPDIVQSSSLSSLGNEILEMPDRSTLERTEMEAALHRFKTWPGKWIKEGKAPFIHASLYANDMPKPLQDAYAACAIHSTKTDQNAMIALAVIESMANELMRSEQGVWSSLELLAAIQALLIFQFIRLFDGDIRQRSQAEKAEPVLEAWNSQLNSMTATERTYTTETAPGWLQWTFAESIRRTSAMVVFLSGIYSLAKNGYCTRGHQVSAHSFTAQRKLWHATGPLEWERVKANHDPLWTPGMNFDNVIRRANGDELDDFGMVMLITYKGQDAVDHWLSIS